MAHILLLDDSPSVLDLVGRWLTAAGHQVIKRGSGQHVGLLLRTTSFDLVITDIYMPEADGIELLRLLRTRHRQLPCIAISADVDDMDFLAAARQLGAVATLHKPFAEADLHAAVATALAGAVASAPVVPPTITSVPFL